MGPPAISPLSFVPLYFTASMLSTSLVAIPTILVATIQNSAPGPPSTMAVATPTILPIPRVVASSVVREAREETLPEDLRPGAYLCLRCLPAYPPLPPFRRVPAAPFAFCSDSRSPIPYVSPARFPEFPL